jgi:hypothetical protein
MSILAGSHRRVSDVLGGIGLTAFAMGLIVRDAEHLYNNSVLGGIGLTAFAMGLIVRDAEHLYNNSV